MKLKNIATAAVSALLLASTGAQASVQSLSLSNSPAFARASTSAEESNEFAPALIVVFVLVAGALTYVVVDGDDDDSN